MASKKTKKHIPPSREKYETSHPVISFRITKSLKDSLHTLQKETGESYSTILKRLLEDNKDLIEDVGKKRYKKGYKQGYSHAITDFGIYYTCNSCNKISYVKAHSDKHKEIIHYAKTHNWICNVCEVESSL